MFPANSRTKALSRGLDGFQIGGKAVESGNDSERAGVIERSIAYMTQHLNQPLRVAELAAQVSVSPSYFFALFKRRMGSAPIDYFTHLRMHYARRLLSESFASVKEVAAEVGYDDPFYFSRVFKAVHGVPPSRYLIAKLEEGNDTGTMDSPPIMSRDNLMAV